MKIPLPTVDGVACPPLKSRVKPREVFLKTMLTVVTMNRQVRHLVRTHDVEFTQMLYGCMMGSPKITNLIAGIDQDKLRELYRILQFMNPLLDHNDEPVTFNMLRTMACLGQTVPEETE